MTLDKGRRFSTLETLCSFASTDVVENLQTLSGTTDSSFPYQFQVGGCLRAIVC